MPDAHVEIVGIRKHFGGIQALNGVDLTIRRGEVHGILGPNGSGKSTLVKILSGLVRPDDGTVLVDGESLRHDVLAAGRAGITALPQEIVVAPRLTVEENVVFGCEPRRAGLVSGRRRRELARRVMRDLGIELDPDAMMQDVSPVERRLLMLGAALLRGARLVILDEPTAGMPTEETERILSTVERLKRAGTTTIFISHRLDEVVALCDRVTVLQNGRVVERFDDRRPTRAQLLHLMAPKAVVDTETAAKPPTVRRGECVLRVEDAGGLTFNALRMSVHRGEVVGVAGGLGSGMEEFGEVVAARRRLQTGALFVGSRQARVTNPTQAARAGLLAISGDRSRLVIRGRSVWFHLCLPTLARRSHLWLVNTRSEKRVAAGAVRAVGAIAPVDQPLESLSGGNQQRVLFGRAAIAEPDLLIAYEPSVGIDVAGRELLRTHMLRLREAHGLLVLSSDPEELVGLCDRVVCLRNGAVSAELTGDDVTVHGILDAVT